MSALSVIATPRRHANVLQHMAGYFKDHLDAESKREPGDRAAKAGPYLLTKVVAYVDEGRGVGEEGRRVR